MKSFLTGLATGLAIGYLTAPHSGKETRDQLKNAADEQTKGLKNQWDKTVSQVKGLVDTAKSQVGLGQSAPNLFADMESGKMDKYKDDANYKKEQVEAEHNDKMDDVADKAKSAVNKAEDVLKVN